MRAPFEVGSMQVLGREVGNFYTRSELKHLIQIHVEHPENKVSGSALLLCHSDPTCGL